MKVIAINGSPRKNGNTAILLNRALDGAASNSNETEYIHLNDLTFKGCMSCFACKRLDGKSYGKCAVNDELSPVLDRIAQAGAVIFGSPIYFRNITGVMRNLLERLLFQYLVYDENYSSLAPQKIKTAFILTMNVPEKKANENGYLDAIDSTMGFIKHVLGPGQIYLSCDTYQFDDYSKYETSGIDANAKTRHHEEQFPIDCKRAFQLGVEIV